MASVTEERIRACLVREGVCEDEAAQRVAAVIAEEIESGDAARVGHDQFEARLAQIDARIARLEATVTQLGREFAERDARLAREMRDFVTSMQELERQRDERERQRDERERERERNWERRYDRFQRVVTIGLSVGFTAMGILIAVLALVA